MRRIGLLLIVALAGPAPAQDAKSAEHPYAKAKVGQWISYKTSGPGMPEPMTMKKVIKARTPDTVTLSVENKLGATAMPASDTVIDLKQKVDPTEPPKVEGGKVEIKKLGEGKEKITVAGKSYDCSWVKLETKTEIGGFKTTSISKIWTCKDVPLDGLVKSEVETNGNKMTMELTGFGDK